MRKGLVSVIICCFNGENDLDRCFGCLLNQTTRLFEVIFVDDGSSDQSFARAQGFVPSFAKEGIDLKCFTQQHNGAGFAAAKGLLQASGEFISCYDVDDILYPESIEKRKSFLDNHPQYALVRTNGFKVSADGEEKRLFITDDVEKKNEDIFEDLLLGKTNNWAGSYMVRADTLWRVYPDHCIPESKYGQNLQILMAVAWQNKAGFIDEPLMEYRYNPSSFTNTNPGFEGAYDRLLGYKAIRLAILERLGIVDKDLSLKMEKIYLSLILDLCIRYQKRQPYLEHYARLQAQETPACLYQYYYHLYSGHRFLSWVYRIACNKTIGQIFRFGIVGVIATILHYGIYLGLKRLIGITVAYIIGYGLSFIANYFLTTCFTFQTKASLQTGFGFVGAHLFNLALQTGLLHAFIHLGVNSSWAPIPVYAIAIPVNFLMVRFVFSRLSHLNA